MTNSNKLKHIVLNKLIYGKNQHLFHSNIHTNIINKNEISSLTYRIPYISSNIEYYKYNTVFYSNYLDQNIIDNNYELFDFDQIKFLYKNNNLENKSYLTIKPYIKNINTFYKQYFNKYLFPDEQHKQDIFYFDNIEKPIDVINVNNMAFFLSPLYNNKNIAISEQNTILQNANTFVKATDKSHYQEMMNYMTNRHVNYTENNSVPVYDIGFNFIDTISFSTYIDIISWLSSYNLLDLSGKVMFIDEKTDYYSINIHSLLSSITLDQKYNYIYSSDSISKLLVNLVSNIETKSSVNKFIDKYGIISKLNKNCLKIILKNPILSSVFHLENNEIKSNFNKTYVDSFTINDIPQNSLYFSNLNKTISFKNQDYKKLSTNISFVNLKNQQDPEYNYDISLPKNLYDIIGYAENYKYISLSNNNNIFNSINKPIIIDLSNVGIYKIKYSSDTFYYQTYLFKSYNNALPYEFLKSYNISSNVSQIIKTTKENYPNYDYSASALLTSHIIQAAYESKAFKTQEYIHDNKILFNKNFGIDFNIFPKEYLYRISGFNNILVPQNNINFYGSFIASTQVFYNDLINIYFPSGITYFSLYDNNNNCISTNILINDFDGINHKQNVNGIVHIPKNNTYHLECYFYSPYTIYGKGTFQYNIIDEFENIENYIDNYQTMMYFDIDRTKSQQNYYNNYSYINNTRYLNPNKNVTSSLLHNSAKKDYQYALSNENYRNNHDKRLIEKVDNYLNQYKELHVETNRTPEIGTINGIRLYQHIGKITDSLFWTSFKYITTYSNSLIKAMSLSKVLPFSVYNINRLTQHMELNELGNINYKGIENIKAMNNNSKTQQYVFISQNNNNFLCSSCFFCPLPKDKKCNCGYCTFPYNHEATNNTYGTYPNQVFWNLNNYNKVKNINNNSLDLLSDSLSLLYLNIATYYKQNLFTKTDLNINDDLEIYFISKQISIDNIKNLFKNSNFKPYTFTSIFQGFGGLRETSGNYILYPNYLMVNNKDNTTENKYVYSNIKNSFNSIFQYIPENLENSTKPFSFIFQNKTIQTIIKDFITLKNNQHFVNSNYEIEDLSDQELLFIKNKIISAIESTKFSFILNINISLLNKYASNTPVKDHTQYTYKQIAEMSLYDILCTNNFFNNILINFHQKQIIEETYILNNNFVISKYSPFNGPHTIKNNTKLYGLLLSGNTVDQIFNNLPKNISEFKPTYDIPENYNVILRVVNWWDNLIKCTGSIICTPNNEYIEQNNTLSTINYTVNQFDFVEAIDDSNFLRLNQNNYKKTNIYSVKIKNSGLNPDNMLFDNLKSTIILSEYISLDQIYKNLYDHIDYNSIETDLQLSSVTNIEQHYKYMLQISNESTNQFLQIHKPDKNVLYKNDSMLEEYYKNSNGYWVLNNESVNKIENLKTDLRNNLENAIKNSITRYMPAETKIWKIIYNGK